MPRPRIPSPATRRVLRKLGTDLREARQRRRLSMAVVAARTLTSRASLPWVEAGEPRVSMGIYAAVLPAPGLLERLDQLADPAHDEIGQVPASGDLPQRAPMSTKCSKQSGERR